MSDTEDFPKLNEDETSSNDSENEDIDETDSENSDNSNENDISASALLSALRDAGQKTNQIEDLSEMDRLDEKFLIENFNRVS